MLDDHGTGLIGNIRNNPQRIVHKLLSAAITLTYEVLRDWGRHSGMLK
jgi:hypothetical protein